MKPWSEIRHKGTPEQVAKARQDLEKLYGRPWWRLVRLWDRLRGR